MSKKGFTLVELLVAISIIAILSAIGMIVFGNVQMQARDSKRKQDLRAISTALEIYYNKNGKYPNTDALWVYSGNAQPWIPGLNSQYMVQVPTDPKSNLIERVWEQPGTGYGYWSNYSNSNGCDAAINKDKNQFYMLITHLENYSDPDRLEVKRNKWCNGNDLLTVNWNGRPWAPYVFIITSP